MSLIIRKINFKDEPLGKYTLGQIEKTWKEAFNFMGINEGRCKIAVDKEKIKDACK